MGIASSDSRRPAEAGKPPARTARELSEALNINTNTARAVYQRLEHEGIIDCQQGSGSFVAQAPQRHSAVGAIAANAAEEAHATGVDPRDVAAALYVAPESSSGDSSEQAQRRRALRTQISVLERTVAELEAKHPTLAAKPAPSPAAEPGPRLLGEEELEQLQAELDTAPGGDPGSDRQARPSPGQRSPAGPERSPAGHEPSRGLRRRA